MSKKFKLWNEQLSQNLYLNKHIDFYCDGTRVGVAALLHGIRLLLLSEWERGAYSSESAAVYSTGSILLYIVGVASF